MRRFRYFIVGFVITIGGCCFPTGAASSDVPLLEDEVTIICILKRTNLGQYVESSLCTAERFDISDTVSIDRNSVIHTPVLELREGHAKFQLTEQQSKIISNDNMPAKARTLTDDAATLSHYLFPPLDNGVAFSCTISEMELYGFWLLSEKSYLKIFPFRFSLSTDQEQKFEKAFR